MGQKSEFAYRSRVRAKGQVTLPQEVRAELGLQEGDDIQFRPNENGEFVIEPLLTIPPEQAWFWSERWQKMEREAQADIESGRVSRYKDIDQAIEALEDMPDAGD